MKNFTWDLIRFVWKYICRGILYAFINVVPINWIPYLIIGAIGGLPGNIVVKEEEMNREKTDRYN